MSFPTGLIIGWMESRAVMGDMAEDAIGGFIDDWLRDDEDGYGEYAASYGPQLKTCRYCKEPGLHWGDAGRGWELFNARGAVHVCSVKDVFK